MAKVFHEVAASKPPRPTMRSAIGSPESEAHGKGGGMSKGAKDPSSRMSGPKPPEDNIKSTQSRGATPRAAKGGLMGQGSTTMKEVARHDNPGGGGYGNRNFGRDDYHGTTNVRSRHIDKAVSGPGGTKHINSTINAPMRIGPHSDSQRAPMPSASPLNDMDADDRESPEWVGPSTVPMRQSGGGFS